MYEELLPQLQYLMLVLGMLVKLLQFLAKLVVHWGIFSNVKRDCVPFCARLELIQAMHELQAGQSANPVSIGSQRAHHSAGNGNGRDRQWVEGIGIAVTHCCL